MTHLELLIKELKQEQEIDKLKLQELENKVSDLETEVDTLHSQNLELDDKVSVLKTENTEQYELIEEQDTKINALTLNVTELVYALKAETNERVIALAKAADEQKVALAKAADEQKVALAKAADAHELALDRAYIKALKEQDLALAKLNSEWMVKFEENNHQWEIKLERQAEFFKAEIAEVRGRLDNLEAQMRAMQVDTDALKAKIDNLAIPVSVEEKQQINRDLANLVALSYSTVSNLQLIDPTYEQRQHWYVMLKEVFKLTKRLARFRFNVKQHLSFVQLMFKTHPC